MQHQRLALCKAHKARPLLAVTRSIALLTRRAKPWLAPNTSSQSEPCFEIKTCLRAYLHSFNAGDSKALQQSLIQADLHFHTRRQVELHQRVYGLFGGFYNIQESFMGPDFILISRVFIYVGRD